MNEARLLQLVEAHLDGRLPPDEARELSAELARSPQACRLFWELAHQHALLSELVAEGAGRRLAEAETVRPHRPALTLRRWVGWLAALAASLLMGAGAWWLLAPGPRTTPPPQPRQENAALARLSELRGDVHLAIGQTLKKALPGMKVLAGMEVQTGPDGAAVVAYADRSRLRLGPDSAIRVLGPDAESPDDTRKRVYLVRGAVNAHVAPQPAGRPMVVRTRQGDLLAVGTRFSWADLLGEARIEMEAGRATFTTPDRPDGLTLNLGTFALVSSPSPEVYQSAPLLPASDGPSQVIEEGTGPVVGLAVSPDGRTLAVPSWAGGVRLWDVARRRFARTLDVPPGRPSGMAYSPDGRLLAVGSEGKKKHQFGLVVLDARKGTPRHRLPSRKPHGLVWLPDGRSLVFAAHEKGRSAYVWDLGDSRERLYLGDGERILSLASSPDGTTVAAGCQDGNVVLHDLTTGRTTRTLRGHKRDVQAVAWQPGGALLASGGRDGKVRLWDVASGEPVRVLSGKFGEVRCLAFSPDGRALASGHGGVVMIWDVATGACHTTIKAHQFAVTAVAYFPHGRTLATAGWDRTVKLWELARREAD